MTSGQQQGKDTTKLKNDQHILIIYALQHKLRIPQYGNKTGSCHRDRVKLLDEKKNKTYSKEKGESNHNRFLNFYYQPSQYSTKT